jgi:vacuolar protein sorting-associated protein 13A/C
LFLGLSVITLDKEFQANRILKSARNRPKHAVSGVTTGATSLMNSLASGVTGVVTKPVEGFEKDGVGGFFKGIGKGLVGYLVQNFV